MSTPDRRAGQPPRVPVAAADQGRRASPARRSSTSRRRSARTQSNLGALLVDYGAGHAGRPRRREGISNTTTRTCWGVDQRPACAGLHDRRTCTASAADRHRVLPRGHQARRRPSRSGASRAASWTRPTATRCVTGREPRDDRPEVPLQVPDHADRAHLQGRPPDRHRRRRPTTRCGTVGHRHRRRPSSRVDTQAVEGHRCRSRAATPRLAAAGGTDAETVAPGARHGCRPNIDVARPTDPTGTVVTYTPPTATDNEDPNPTVTCTPASGTKFAVGTTTVTCTAKDANGNDVGGKTFNVVVARRPGQRRPSAAPCRRRCR